MHNLSRRKSSIAGPVVCTEILNAFAGETDGDDIAHFKSPYNLGPHWECVQWRHFVTFYCSLQPAYCSLQPRG